MKKLLVLFAVAISIVGEAFAGDYLTNTNQSIAYLRMIARGATSDIDAVYYNPAGLAWAKKDGWALSLNIQSAYQNRDIYATYAVNNYLGYNGTPESVKSNNFAKKYTGEAKAPVLPSVYLTYKKNKWVASFGFGVVGGGGNAKFKKGLPMFDSQVQFGIANNQALAGMVGLLAQNGAPVTSAHDLYDINSALNGKQILFGAQIGATYKVTDWFSVFGGLRFNYFTGGYDGYLYADMKEAYAPIYMQATQQQSATLTKIVLDCEQTGFGVTPILGASFKFKKLTLAGKYEFKANMELENDTKELEGPQGSDALNAYADGVKTANDIPAFLSVAAGYEFLPYLRATFEYHRFMDKQADMAGGKEKFLKHGTNEYLAGLEWDICKLVTVSAGYQLTDYGLSDDFQSDVAFSCDSYAVGFGGALNLSKCVKLNVAYFFSKYQNYNMDFTNYHAISQTMTVPSVQGAKVYKRTNQVFGLGVDFTF